MSVSHRQVTNRLPLPPYGRRYLDERPCCGPWIAMGSKAWDLARRKAVPVMVLPEDKDPANFRWPVRNQAVLLFEIGSSDRIRLERMVQVLLESGAKMVVPIREAELDDNTVYWRSERDARHAA